MTVKKRKKSVRQRGSRTHGYGLTHRGSGNRGGKGKAGTGKKAKCKMPVKGGWTIQGFGKKGFKSKGVRYAVKSVINLRHLEGILDVLLKNKTAVLDKDIYTINLDDLGIDKLLSSGRATKRWRITVRFASAAAVDKIKAAGGDVVLPKPEQAKIPEAKKQGKEE